MFGPHYQSLGYHFFQRPDPFNAVGNIAVLLQSLDDDGDPDNAIVIKAGVAKLFRGVRLDLYPQENGLPGYMDGAGAPGNFPTLHYKLAQANSNRLFNAAHGEVNRAIAFQDLYRALGIPSRTYAICPGGWDFNDAEVDCRYDDNGNLTQFERNHDRFGHAGPDRELAIPNHWMGASLFGPGYLVAAFLRRDFLPSTADAGNPKQSCATPGLRATISRLTDPLL